jgi:hypothetical protein
MHSFSIMFNRNNQQLWSHTIQWAKHNRDAGSSCEQSNRDALSSSEQVIEMLV